MSTLSLQPTPSQPPAGDLIKDTTTQTFVADVIEASKAQPVLVDFWAPWCGPCKQLTPVLEKVVRDAKGKVRLVKMNIDDHPAVAQQMGIQSIPAVIAFKAGRPVDGFMGALPESQVKQFIETVAGEIGPSDAEALLAEAEQLLQAGDPATAAQAYAAALELEPENAKGLGGLAQAYLAVGEVEQAKGVLAGVPEAKRGDPAVAAARAAIELAEKSAQLGDLGPLMARVEADPKDHQARFDLAVGLAAAGKREDAVDHLIEIVRRDRAWNEDGARKQLVQFFEAWGPTDEMTLYGRRRLSAVLFS
jgi:putative thioredoxin